MNEPREHTPANADAPHFQATPWDERALGVPTYELKSAGEEALRAAGRRVGHFTVRIEPTASKHLLHRYGFYYCDTLVEPYCRREALIGVTRPAVTIRRDPDPETMLAICRGAFTHGRFHRDFHVPQPKADLRYENWLADLLAAGRVLGLFHEGTPAGFIAHQDGKLVLHALAPAFRGRGLARPFWSLACADLFAHGYDEITSSISLGNMPALNLYASLGFRFRNPRDLYHLYNPAAETGDG